MKIRKRDSDEEKIELQMTAMIDIVFQLLVFFIMTFKIVDVEGDFRMRQPAASKAAGDPDPDKIIQKVKLEADSDGVLTSIRIDDNSFGTDFKELQAHFIEHAGDIGPEAAAEEEVEIDPAYNLKYQNVIKAMSAITGYRSGDEITPLMQKVKLSQPRPNPDGDE